MIVSKREPVAMPDRSLRMRIFEYVKRIVRQPPCSIAATGWLFRHSVVVLLAWAAVPKAAMAWGPEGHRIVGYIAAHNLTPNARLSVRTILGGKSLASAANWMDEMRADATYGPMMKRWHYDDVDICANPPSQTACPDGQCALQRIVLSSATLAGPSSKAEKLFALRVLVHLVGDVHQPLHSADHGDAGGNGIQLRNRKLCHDAHGREIECNLHQYWDGVVLRQMLNRAAQPSSEISFARRLGQQYPPPPLTSPQVWVDEAAIVARNDAYDPLPGFACSASGKFATEVDALYDDQAMADIEQQLARAGHRLAQVLNAIFP